MVDRHLNKFPTLTTDRLILRQLAMSDVKEIFLLRSDNFINKYLNRQKCKTVEDALEFIEKIKNNSLYYWAITEKGNEKLLGTVCLFGISEKLKNCEIGYELLKDYQGKGIMREAVNEIIEYAIQSIGLKTIDAYTHKDNQNSSRLLESLNFKHIENLEETKSNLILFSLNTNIK